MISTYLAFTFSATLLISSPGPVISVIIANSKIGKPIKTMMGALLSAQILLITTLITIYFALDINPFLLDVGQVAGGAYLFWLGINSLIDQKKLCVTSSTITRDSFWRALKIGVSNPKDIIFFMAFLPNFINNEVSFLKQSLFLLLIWLFIDFIILLLYSHISKKVFNYKIGNIFLAYAPYITISILGVASFVYGVSSIIA